MFHKNKDYQTPEAFHRQQLGFGQALNQDLSKLKISIIGMGATGSATAIMLARLGVGELFLIDRDTVNESNLNRLHSARKQDIGRYKVDVLKEYIENIELGTIVNSCKEWVGTNESIALLKSSDFIFGCTDDHAGRIVLNRFAYFYLTPVIDMGLTFSVKKESLEIQNLQGRVSYLFPGSDCLLTKGFINLEIANSENLRRKNPQTYESLKKEAYIIGEGNPSPSVVTFTTAVATKAVNEFLNRLIGFNSNFNIPHKLFFFNHDEKINPGNISNNDCPICGKTDYCGMGDYQPFLDMVL